jgi:UDP-glucose 4-epimerase
MLKVLVTGGAGFIGSAVAVALAKKNYEVIIYDLGTWDTKMDDIEYIKGDVFDIAHISNVLKKCDSVIHVVGLPDARIAQEHPQMSFDLNTRSLQVLLEAARNSGVARIILPSSASIYGVAEHSPITEEATPKLTCIYAYHKYVAEKLTEAYSLNYGAHITVLRLFNVFGIKGTGILNILVENAKRGQPVKLYGEKQKRDFIHVSDVADAFIRVLELDHKFEVYNIGTGGGRSIEDLVNLVKEYFPTLSVEHGDYKGVLYDSVADTTKIREATGFSPNRSDDKLREVIQKWGSK